MTEPVILTEDELRERCAYWQKVLRLQDWDVKLAVQRRSEFRNEDNQGECTWTLPKRQAFIRILDPIDYPETRWGQDMETTLVHGLIRLFFAPFVAEDGTLEDVAQEQAIDSLAHALVGLERAAQKTE